VTKALERALENARKAQEKAAELERHERLVALSVQHTKLLRASDYAAATAVNDEIKALLTSGVQKEA